MNEPVKDQYLKGIFFACIAFFLFTLMQAFNKLLVGHHHVVEISFYRNLMALLPCTVYILLTRRYDLLAVKQKTAMATRVGVGTAGLILTFAAVQLLPLSNATVLFFTSTLITPVLAHFFLREHIGLQRWLAVFVGMSGVLLVAQPSMDFTLLGVLIAVCAALTHAVIQVAIRAMKEENPFTITFYFFLGGTVFPGLAMPFFFHAPTLETLPYLIAVGITGGLGQYFLTRGFQLAPASLLSPFNYTGLVWAVALDITIWKHWPDWPVFLGAAIIIASKFFIIYREGKVQKRRN